jgi:hypothetical protein
MHRFYFLAFFLTLVLFYQVVFGQSLDSLLHLYGDQFKQERAFIHFDKSVYIPGDTVWYKVYLTNSSGLSDISKNFYIDWSDDKDSLLLHSMAQINLSSANGQFVIPALYNSNLIHLKAYTTWMLNFDPDFLYYKNIPVIQARHEAYLKKITRKVEVSLLPEGGNLVVGLMSLVAFKATDQYGMPVNIEGVLKNSKGDILDSVRSLHDGMGKFYINPDAGTVYTFSWKDEMNGEGITTLPVAYGLGAVMKILPSKNKIYFQVERSPGAPDNFKTMNMLVISGGQEVFKIKLNLSEESSISSTIPLTGLPTGILQITLFDAGWIPVSERIVFVNNKEFQLPAGVTCTVKNLTKRGKNEIEINVPDSLGTNLSIAITDGGLHDDSTNNIISHFLLTSELKGYVFNPAYYFSDKSDSAKDHLDLLMLTSGWRKYNWDDMMKGRLPVLKYPKETDYIVIKGKANLSKYHDLKDSTQISMFIQPKNRADTGSNQWATSTLNPDGSFLINNKLYYDTVFIYYHLNNNNKSFNTNVDFQNGLYPDRFITQTSENYLFQGDNFSGNKYLELTDKYEELFRLMKATTLKEVTITAKAKSKIQIVDEEYASMPFQGFPNSAYAFDVANDKEFTGYSSISRYVTSKIVSLQGGPNGYVYRGGLGVGDHTQGRVELFLNESITDASTLESIPLSEVSYIKFYRRGGLVFANNNPALLVYLKNGSEINSTDTSIMRHKMLIGYTHKKEFYTPNYIKDDKTAKNRQDLRTTLYWDPYVLTNAVNQKVKIVFFNNDLSKKLRIVLQGLNTEGKFVCVEKLIE